MQSKSYNQSANIVAASLSGLCLCHCLFLPVIVSLAPMFSVLGAEWVHKLLVLATAPISLSVLLKTTKLSDRIVLAICIGLGLALLFLGAFVEALHDYETPLTVLGAITLAATHTLRWLQHRANNYPPEEHL